MLYQYGSATIVTATTQGSLNLEGPADYISLGYCVGTYYTVVCKLVGTVKLEVLSCCDYCGILIQSVEDSRVFSDCNSTGFCRIFATRMFQTSSKCYDRAVFLWSRPIVHGYYSSK